MTSTEEPNLHDQIELIGQPDEFASTSTDRVDDDLREEWDVPTSPLGDANGFCTADDIAVWKDNMQFSVDLNALANQGMGLPHFFRPLFEAKYSVITEPCRECFVENVYCGLRNCALACAGRSLSPGCLECVGRECVPQFTICIGVTKAEDMPLVPPEPSTTTAAPGKVRTRKQSNVAAANSKATTTTTEEPTTLEAELPSAYESDSSMQDGQGRIILAGSLVIALLAFLIGKTAYRG